MFTFHAFFLSSYYVSKRPVSVFMRITALCSQTAAFCCFCCCSLLANLHYFSTVLLPLFCWISVCRPPPVKQILPWRYIYFACAFSATFLFCFLILFFFAPYFLMHCCCTFALCSTSGSGGFMLGYCVLGRWLVCVFFCCCSPSLLCCVVHTEESTQWLCVWPVGWRVYGPLSTDTRAGTECFHPHHTRYYGDHYHCIEIGYA